MKPFSQISDTARFVALMRWREGRRIDAYFKDEDALALARPVSLILWLMIYKPGDFDYRTMSVRTVVIDEIILDLIKNAGVTAVINLAAGLDTRPYRLNLPEDILWIEADFPHVILHKEEVLKDRKPKCRLERYALDLRDTVKRDKLFAAVCAREEKVMVLTEGLLMYLSEAIVADLSDALKANSGVKYWLTDLLSSEQLARLHKKHGKMFKKANAFPEFAPKEGSGFFEKLGWKVKEHRSFLTEAIRLNRKSLYLKLALLTAPFRSKSNIKKNRDRYTCLLLERK